jgi:MoxR-like ATPase
MGRLQSFATRETGKTAPGFCEKRRRNGADKSMASAAITDGADGGASRLPGTIDETLALLRGADYIGERALATVLFLSLRLGRPLFLEGEAGVGKTEIAKVLAVALGRRLIRLQCYEGLDVASAVYEWNYAGQMMAIRLAEAAGEHDKDRIEHDVFSPRYLIKRPLLQALEPAAEGPSVLLIDEIDRADEAFEAFLLEVLSDFQVTVPEIGTIKAEHPPIVVITSNRTREIHDALKRRCLYHWVGYPDAAREIEIVTAKAPGAPKRLTEELVAFVQALRREDLFKSPGVAETLDWASALTELDAVALDPAQVSDTLGVLLKYQDDIAKIEGAKAAELIQGLRSELRAAAG